MQEEHSATVHGSRIVVMIPMENNSDEVKIIAKFKRSKDLSRFAQT